MAEPLFTVVDDTHVVPSGTSRGPWSEHALHGGPVAALVARAAERALTATGSAAVAPVRLTVDLERPVPLAPLRVATEIVRPGRKVQVAEVQVFDVDDRRLVRATVLALRRTDLALPGDRRVPTDEPPPPPPEAADPPSWDPLPGRPVFHNDGVEHRFVRGGFLILGPSIDWIRLAAPVASGEEPTPFQRAVAASDFVNGISAALPFADWTFINPDLTVTLHRLPVGEHIGIAAATRIDPSGVGTAEADLYDKQGRIGRAVQTLLIEPTGR
jgi:uncharacterized protein (TIGR00369 family)